MIECVKNLHFIQKFIFFKNAKCVQNLAVVPYLVHALFIQISYRNKLVEIEETGNNGIEGSEPFNKLGRNKNAIVVGAINDKDQITSYSSMGIDVKPDLVAPGGSALQGRRSIISADSRSGEATAGYGTSISAAIVSAAINLLIDAKWGTWANWNNQNLSKLVPK